MTSPSATALPPDALASAVRRAALDAPPDDVGRVVAEVLVARLGARSATLRLVDRAGRALHVVGAATRDDDPGEQDAAPLEVGGVLAEVLHAGAVRRAEGALHLPVTIRGGGHGVLTLQGAEIDDAAGTELGEVVALLVVEACRATDFFETRRRSSSYSVSAEMQWQLLPPTSVVTPETEVHALIEPAPRVTSDLFDWSLDGDRLWVAVLEAEGLGLSAATPAAVALAALRHARRCDVTLAEQVALADQALHGRYRGGAIVHALVVCLDLTRREVRAVRASSGAGAPHAFRRRSGEVGEISLRDQEALGVFDRSPYRDEVLDLEPGDELLVVTGGGPSARNRHGEPIGGERIADWFRHADVLAAAPRRLLDAVRSHTGGEPVQDATALVVGWRHREAS